MHLKLHKNIDHWIMHAWIFCTTITNVVRQTHYTLLSMRFKVTVNQIYQNHKIMLLLSYLRFSDLCLTECNFVWQRKRLRCPEVEETPNSLQGGIHMFPCKFCPRQVSTRIILLFSFFAEITVFSTWE